MPDQNGAAPLWGPSTERAYTNFRISGHPMPRSFLAAVIAIKQAAAEANASLGLLDPAKALAISEAAEEVLGGSHWGQFPLDIYQTGSGTSTNMNCNEVLAALASGRLDADVVVHPNDDVNLGQSSNDVVPTAMRIALAVSLQRELLPALTLLEDALARKAEQFWSVIKLGRTHLQEAMPIRLGQEFSGYANQVHDARARLDPAVEELRRVPLGGTAVGTGVNTDHRFAAMVCRNLSENLGFEIVEVSSHFGSQSTLDVTIAAHAAIRGVALALWKIASDIRLLATGFGELTLPDSGVTSSIMPTKSPPAIIESLTMVVARVLGNDQVVGFSQTGSILELNVMMPVVIASSLESVELLVAAVENFTSRCVVGVEATEQGPKNVERSVILSTALSLDIGYDAAAEITKEAIATGKGVREVAQRHGMDPDRLDVLLDPASMTEPSAASRSKGQKKKG